VGREVNAAKLAYRPVGLLGGMAGGMVAGMIFKQVWKRVAGEEDAPGATQREYSWGAVLLAAALQGAIYSVVKAAIDRGGAQAWEKTTGTWPAD
jgi:predicted metal-dependent enzyme (double-stranded beta helix superfamily)